jgi:hypothetical protein
MRRAGNGAEPNQKVLKRQQILSRRRKVNHKKIDTSFDALLAGV